MYIPGSNNGTWGAGMQRALFPTSMGGPLGYRGHPLPNSFQHAAPVINVPYRTNSFGHKSYRKLKHKSKLKLRSKSNKKSKRKSNKKSKRKSNKKYKL